ncbi:endonuclease [Lewinellaceae bacterium SD302]|nr:endonuclease [Lewinellaceae bacterium SD302]
MFVYAIKSSVKDWVYVGMSKDVERRLSEHNRGKEPSTKAFAPFRLIYLEEAPGRTGPLRHQNFLSSKPGSCLREAGFFRW